MNQISNFKLVALALVLACALTSSGLVQAGCPFDDGSCQEYCNQQGCNLGYCGHFAWIQCICRKCGDEWNWYDKVHYKPDKQVNQTELDSLNLNGSAPLIVTNNNKVRVQQLAGRQVAPQVEPAVVKQSQPAATAKQPQQAPQVQKQQAATLTTLLIPDLSDGSRLDLNDIPDENSEKFLDYLAKNHEKLAQATNSKTSQGGPGSVTSAGGEDELDEGDESNSDAAPTTASQEEPIAEETVEIQISSSNNQQPATQQPTPSTSQSNKRQEQQASPAADDDEDEQQQAAGGSVTRLLKMAVARGSSDDIF